MKAIKILAAGAASALAIGLLASCGKTTDSGANEFDTTKVVKKYTRDTTSGTRDGFFTKIDLKDAISDDSKLAKGFIVASSNGDMISKIKNDEYGIGYISLASVADSGLKGLKFEGITPTEEAVVDGTYSLQRNFNYITTTQDNCSATEWTLIKGFMLYMNSKEGLTNIKAKDGILTKSIASAKSFNDLLNEPENADIKAICDVKNVNESDKVTIKFGGSTSVEKIAKELTASFANYCPTFKPSHNHTGSGDAYKGTQGSEKTGASSLHIGFLSRELKSDEAASANTSGLICKDGIVAVVNNANSLENITASQLKAIYTTENIKWNEL